MRHACSETMATSSMRLNRLHAMQNGHMQNGHQVSADRTDGSSTSNVRPLPSQSILLDFVQISASALRMVLNAIITAQSAVVLE